MSSRQPPQGTGLQPSQGQQGIQGISSTTGNGNSNFTEYKLKMSPMAVSHNVMVLNSNTAKLSDFAQPVRMFRDKNSALIQECPGLIGNKLSQGEGAASGAVAPGRIAVGGGSISAPGSRNTFKKKTKIIFQGDEEEIDEQTREAEAVPWLLEDYDAQHSFVGRLEGGQNSNYVFFVNQGDEFRIIPVNKWYRFQSKLSYHTLTIEEAETQMAARKKDDVSRWLMKNRSSPKSSDEDSQSSQTQHQKIQKKIRLAEKVLNGENEQRKKRIQLVRSKFEDSQIGEEIDFDELFDDDEGNDNFGGLLEETQPEEIIKNNIQKTNIPNDQVNKKFNYKLSNEGRAVKKIVKHLDKTNDIIYASDDENDPYASDYENEEEDYDDDFDKWSKEKEKEQGEKEISLSSNSLQSQVKPKISKPSLQATNKSITSTSSTSKSSSILVSPSSSKVSSPPNSPIHPSIKRFKTSDEEDDATTSFISEIELIGHLKQGPISTKDLISKFKRQLKADSKNKEIFRELVRKVAMVKAAGIGEEDKLLELKPEYKQN